MKKSILSILTVCIITFVTICTTSCSNTINTNYDSHFTEEGEYINDSTKTEFELRNPSKVKFYVEVSGSMNGYFRANCPTDFKTDLWRIMNFYSPLVSDVCILTNDGNQGISIGMNQFHTMMNTGSFISSSSTKIPLMLQTIIDNLDANAGEVAILISDMKYSPVDEAAPDVLMSHYSTDVSTILGKYGKAVSLVGATSNYLDKNGNEDCASSPYYYFIIGNAEQVAEMRNGISSLLEKGGHFIDNIDSGFDFGSPKYSFGVSNRCDQLENQPTFTGYEEFEDNDTCYIEIKIELENYRWRITDKSVFAKAFKAKPKYGSEVKVGNIEIKAENITGDEKELKRKATATVKLHVFNMATDSEVIEWNLELPDTDYTLFGEYFDNSTGEGDPSKSYSLIDFVKGIFQGGVVNKTSAPNYILVSKKN